METKTKQLLNRNFTGKEQQYPIKVLQFGEGNFLRAFVDYAFYRLNNELSFNAGIAVVQPLEGGMVDLIEKKRNGLELSEEEINFIIKTYDPEWQCLLPTERVTVNIPDR